MNCTIVKGSSTCDQKGQKHSLCEHSITSIYSCHCVSLVEAELVHPPLLPPEDAFWEGQHHLRGRGRGEEGRVRRKEQKGVVTTI
jgi:hypothetical protein